MNLFAVSAAVQALKQDLDDFIPAIEKAKNKTIPRADLISGNYSRHLHYLENGDGNIVHYHKDVDWLQKKRRLVRRQYKDAVTALYIELCRNERLGYPCLSETIEDIYIKHVYYPDPDETNTEKINDCEYLRSEYFAHRPYRPPPNVSRMREVDEGNTAIEEGNQE